MKPTQTTGDRRTLPRPPFSGSGRDSRPYLKTLRRVGAVAVLVVVLIGVGTVGFHYIEGWPWFQSLYGTMMTISTIGAEPENQISEIGRRFNLILMVMGVVVVGFAIGTFTQAVIEFELGSFFGRRRMEKEISKLKDHFIICGAGRVGRKVAMEIASRNLPLVIVESDPVQAKWAFEQNYPVIIGDATKEELLTLARIEFAAGLASAVTSDAQNVYIVLTAHGMRPDLPIVARASEDGAESKLLKAGASTVISPYTFAGQRIARVLTRPNVQRFLDLALSSLNEGDLDLQIEEVRIHVRSKLAGSKLAEADVRHRLGVIVLAIRQEGGKLDFNPGPDRKISAGDCLIAMGDARKLKELETLAGV